MFGCLVVVVLSPIIYEFQPLKSVDNYTQCKIVKDGNKVVGLEKNATGFHFPFFSGAKFILLPQAFQIEKSITCYFGEGNSVDIPCVFICEDCSKAFVASKGALTFQENPVTEVKNTFIAWVRKDFEDFLVLQITNNPKKFETAQEAKKFVEKSAKEWTESNGYFCRIEVGKPRNQKSGQGLRVID
jgi:hypothetical protein